MTGIIGQTSRECREVFDRPDQGCDPSRSHW